MHVAAQADNPFTLKNAVPETQNAAVFRHTNGAVMRPCSIMGVVLPAHPVQKQAAY